MHVALRRRGPQPLRIAARRLRIRVRSREHALPAAARSEIDLRVEHAESRTPRATRSSRPRPSRVVSWPTANEPTRIVKAASAGSSRSDAARHGLGNGRRLRVHRCGRRRDPLGGTRQPPAPRRRSAGRHRPTRRRRPTPRAGRTAAAATSDARRLNQCRTVRPRRLQVEALRRVRDHLGRDAIGAHREAGEQRAIANQIDQARECRPTSGAPAAAPSRVKVTAAPPPAIVSRCATYAATVSSSSGFSS